MTALQGLPNNIMHPTRCMGLDFREGGRGRVMMGVGLKKLEVEILIL
jgi:hypothetical protein